MAKEDFVTTREAADKLGVSLRTVQLWVENGLLCAWKTAGGHRRILKKSVDELLHERANGVKEPQRHAANGGFNLVLVEREPQLIKLFHRQVAALKLPIRILTAPNGFSALLQIGQWLPDLVFTDLLMPDMDGFRMIAAIREHPDLGNTKIIALTSLSEVEVGLQGELPPGVLLMQKPIGFDRLAGLIHGLIKDPQTEAA